MLFIKFSCVAAYQVESVSFSPDGKLLGAGKECFIFNQLWDWAAGELVQLIQPHTKWHHSSGQPVQIPEECWKWAGNITFNADGKLLASRSSRSGVYLWDVASGESVSLLEEDDHTDIRSVVISADSKLLALVKNSTVQLWDVTSSQKLQSLQLTYMRSGNPACVVFSPDSKLLASVGDGLVRLWQLTH